MNTDHALQHGISAGAMSRHAIIIGGSMTGLLAARVLSQHFTQVTLIERDKLSDRSESRQGQPQTRHTHGLLAGGKQILESYFPGLMASLHQGGATLSDMAQETRWHVFGDYRLQYQCGMEGVLCSRPFLEWQIRRRVLAIPNLTVLDHSRVEDLLTTSDRSQVTGVQVYSRTEQKSHSLTADLVVDASGRNSASLRWLTALGYQNPPETVVTVEVNYATRLYRRQASDRQSNPLRGAVNLIISAHPPTCCRSGLAFPIEGDRWIVTLTSWGQEQPPLDDAGWLAFCQSLPSPDLYDLLQQAEPLSEPIAYRFPASLRRHYDRLSRFPSGYLVMGDALCSFDPAYGQGMTSAALQAALLDKLLHKPSVSYQGLARRFFREAAKIIDIPWNLTVTEDFRFSSTKGKKPWGTDWINAYGALVQKATHTDAIVYTAFLKVMNLMTPPSSLFRPQILWRVFQAIQKKQFVNSSPDAATLNPSEGNAGLTVTS